jgi:type I restriction enzyme R subunit
MSLTESTVEDVALEWFGELGYAVGQGPHPASGEPASRDGGRDSFSEVVLVGRSREAIRRMNPAIPEEASTCASHADRRATGKRCLQVRMERRQQP